MKSSFNFIAPFYDLLARIVFGKSIVKSQTQFFNRIPANASILILGGGTGWLLEQLVANNPSCSIWYVEASSKMMQMSKNRKLAGNISYILGTQDDIPDGRMFDVIITNFYLDLFSEARLADVIQKISLHTTPSSNWFATDFVDNGKWWQGAMLKIMYVFFRNVSGIEAARLPAWEKCMLQHQWDEQDRGLWYNSFIKSVIFRPRAVI